MQRISTKVASQLQSQHTAVWFAALALVGWLLFVVIVYYNDLWKTILYGGWPRPNLYGDPALPYLGEAARQAFTSIGGASLLLLSAASAGDLLARAFRWQYRSWYEGLVFSISIGIGGFAAMGLALALVGLYRPDILRLLVSLPLVIRAIRWASGRRRAGLAKNRTRAYSLGSLAGVRSRLDLPTGMDRIWAGVLLVSLLVAAVAALAPEIEYDALWYHLAYPQRFLEAGRLVDLPDDYVSLYPMTWELWFGYGLALGGLVTAKLLHFACLPLGAAALGAFTRRFLPGVSPWLAAALFTSTPLVLWEASTAYVDLALAFHFFLAAYALMAVRAPADVFRRQWLLLGGANLGLALGTKHLALPLAGLLVLGFWLREARLHRSLLPAIVTVISLVGIALLLALPWYMRAALATGNPVFPELYEVFGAPPERWDAQTNQGLQNFFDRFGRDRTLVNLVTLPWHMTMHAAGYGGSLGPVFLGLLPGMLLLVLRRTAAAWLGALLGLFLVFWASPLSSFQMRFLTPVVPFLALLSAGAVRQTASLLRKVLTIQPWRRQPVLMLYGFIGFLLLLNMPPFTPFHERDRAGNQGWLNHTLHDLPLGVVIGAESQADYLRRSVRSYRVWEWANAHLPPEVYVLTWTGGDQTYAQRDRLWAYAVRARPVMRAHEDQSALEHLRRLGVTHLILERPEHISFSEELNLAVYRATFQDRWLDFLYTDRYYALARIRWEDLTGAHPTAEAAGPPL